LLVSVDSKCKYQASDFEDCIAPIGARVGSNYIPELSMPCRGIALRNMKKFLSYLI